MNAGREWPRTESAIMVLTEPILGGFVICRPAPLEFTTNSKIGLRLMSDLHIGAPHVDYKKIKEELDDAVKNKDRVLLNGDVLDMILPKDVKRFAPDSLHPRLQGRRDVINSAVEWAVEILSPAAHLIDMVGVGNHETAVEKFHSFDPTMILVHELSKVAATRNENHQVHYGGYTGFVDYRFRKKKVSGRRYVVYYHHGSGAAAPVTKGLIDFNRRSTFIVADIIWMGHKHNRLNVHVEQLSCPQDGDQPRIRDVRHIMTGGYFKTYVGQGQKSIHQHGRRSNYAADSGMAPQGIGGCKVELTFPHDDNAILVEVKQ